MLAGVGGIDLVVLVIAADEGIKPQTREHFDICRLLGIRHGITVLTKSDMIDPETLAVVRLEVADFLSGSFLENSEIVPVSALKSTGLDELKRQLVRIASNLPARDSAAITRLPIDRVFTMKGFGTVVTGTLVAGTIHKEDELQLFPTGKKVRVRGVQVHSASTETAHAGERTALNLAGVDKEELERGMVLASPGMLQTSSRIDVQLTLLRSAKPLKNNARVHLHAFAAETIATVSLYETKQLNPGSESFAQLRLSAPLLLLPGDRFIIRQFSPVITIGGGVVLDAFPMPKQRLDARERLLTAGATGNHERMLTARIARRGPSGISLERLITETGWAANAIRAKLDPWLRNGATAKLGNYFLAPGSVSGLKAALLSALELFQTQNPLSPGMSQQTLREKFALDPEVFSAVITQLVKEGKAEAAGDIIHLRGRGVVMKDEEAASRKMIEQAFSAAGLKVPALKDVLASLKIDKARAQKLVTLLLRDKVLIKVSDYLVFHQIALTELRKNLAVQKASSPKIDVGRFKDLTGVSRKYAIPLLEYLDRERVTKRVGDERVIL
jgi:selenocysteine-specific elongation factor